jgi:glutamyl-tRNA(Gln) amidotransferase subunit E
LGSKNENLKAMDVIRNRVKAAFKGVPPETRRALENGNTEFLRELHGGARLYPDTDSKAILNTEKEIEDIKNNLPEYPWILIKNYSKKYKTQERLIKELIFKGIIDLFDKLISIYDDNPSLIITTLLETTKSLKREGKKVGNVREQDYIDIFSLLKKKEIGKEAIEEFISLKADSPELTIDQIKKELKIQRLTIEELRQIIWQIVKKNEEMLKEKGMRAMGPLMGLVMKQVRGKIDGSIVSKELERILKQALKELK